MQLPQARALVEQQFNDLPSSVRLVVVHPEFRVRYLVIQSAVENGAVYVRLTGDKLEVASLQMQLDAAFAALRQSNKRAGAVDVVIDECDRVRQNVLPAFLRQLTAVKGVARIYIVSRLLPHDVLADSDLQPITRVLPTHEQHQLIDYVLQEGQSAHLEIRAFGRGRVQIDGRSIVDWGGVLPRAMFFYLIDRGMVTRSEIFDTFWRSLSIADATNVFHVTKRKISEVLDSVLTQFGGGFYHLSTDLRIAYDVNLFNECYDVGQIGQGDEAIDALERGIDLYRGEFLSGLEMKWAVDRRDSLRSMYNEMLATLANRYQEIGDTLRAYAMYLRASANNPAREDLVRAILTLALELNTPQDGDMVYNRLRVELRRQVDIDPSPETRALYDLLRGGARV